MVKIQKPDRQTAGNAMLIILVAVAIFAMLTFSLTRSDRSRGDISDEDRLMMMNDMMSYAAQLSTAVEAVMTQNGCADTQINFASVEWSTPAWYVNPDAPVDGSCDVFGSGGGGALFKAPARDTLSQGATEYLVTGSSGVEQIGTSTSVNGTDDKDLMLFAVVSMQMCILVNSRLGIVNTGGIPPQGSIPAFGATPVANDVFGAARRYHNGDVVDASELTGQSTGCYQSTGDSLYYFYHVLLAR